MALIQIGFVLSIVIFATYWSIVLEDGIVVRKFNKYEFLFFGSIWRTVIFYVTISLAFGIIGIVVDISQVYLFLVMNLIGLPVSLLSFSYYLKSVSINEQLSLWKHEFDNPDDTSSMLVEDIENLIGQMKSTSQLIKFFKLFINSNSMGIAIIKASIQQLQEKNVVPLELSNSILLL